MSNRKEPNEMNTALNELLQQITQAFEKTYDILLKIQNTQGIDINEIKKELRKTLLELDERYCNVLAELGNAVSPKEL